MAGRKVAVAIDPAHREEVFSDPEKARELALCATDFRHFLKHWRFRDQRTGVIRRLGAELWAGQEKYVDEVGGHDWVFALKARKLGYTTIEEAYDGWCLRFRALEQPADIVDESTGDVIGSANARVHLFSRRADAANELLETVVFGLDGLPEWMRLPKTKDTTSEVWYAADPEDKRILKAYPADEETAVEATCNHGHVDEWARMANPRKVLQAIEPSMAGSCHIITTGLGPNNYSAEWWMRCMAGESKFHPFFVGALNRPDRDEAWFEEKVRTMPERERKHEYPLVWEEALFGGADLMFDGLLAAATRDAYGPMDPQPGHRYIKSWDVGRHKDAAVGIVFDVTGDVIDVVHYQRLRGVPYPDLQARIEQVHEAYPGLTVIEKNAAGEAVMENLKIREHEREGFATTGPSKSRILEGLVEGFQQQTVKYSAAAWPQLDAELKRYSIPDDKLVQDSVMAMAIGYDYVGRKPKAGRVRRIQTW